MFISIGSHTNENEISKMRFLGKTIVKIIQGKFDNFRLRFVEVVLWVWYVLKNRKLTE